MTIVTSGICGGALLVLRVLDETMRCAAFIKSSYSYHCNIYIIAIAVYVPTGSRAAAWQ
jgi:hypothetical protein